MSSLSTELLRSSEGKNKQTCWEENEKCYGNRFRFVGSRRSFFIGSKRHPNAGRQRLKILFKEGYYVH